ncbi:diacylglycerol kinase catalytic domain-containing protein [Hirsutella rhossiliensis]|uniref:Diacylglycerol kinase catalytic domain-containing protein n=1 Tax=Hirsutella rhossiliensis TaxID=111463 RepID=A0A9P8N6Z7_9HYPO|nr:diacylglycerol kinase catalytic domain-containing protein [Hirsutella rhossiliensis]KAH0965787.1 diacylglycerol kinase catalytic domain-containing protein [Hirsutella rhossiliensis]
MAGAAKPSSEAHRLSVRHVRVQDDNLLWTTGDGGGRDGRASVDDILFTLARSESARDQSAFIICCLQVNLEHPTQPFQLLLLAADAVPDQLLNERGVSQLPSHLCSGNDNQVDVVVSVKSGLGLALTFWQAVLRPLLELAHQVLGSSLQLPSAVVTEDARSVRQFARTLQRGQERGAPSSRTVILLSGDGGVVDLLNGHEAVSGSPRPLLALLPLGTGNALFHSLHKPVASDPGPSPLVLGLRTLFLGASADLPVFQATFSPGAHTVSHVEVVKQTGGAPVARQDTPVSTLHAAIVASYGFHASIVFESDTPEYRAHGDKRFGMVAQELLRESHPYKANLSVRSPSSARFEQDPHQKHAYILVSMVSNLQRAFTISPANKPLDGRLHLVHFGPVGGERTMDVMMKAYDGGRHVGMKWDDGEAVRYEEVGEVVVEALDDDARWRKFCVDGIIVEVPKGGSMTVSRAPGMPFRILVDSQCQQRA